MLRYTRRTRNIGINHQSSRTLLCHYYLLRSSTASRYAPSAINSTSPKSSGQSPKAPFLSRSALRIDVVPSSGSRENQCSFTELGSISPFAINVCTWRNNNALCVSTTNFTPRFAVSAKIFASAYCARGCKCNSGCSRYTSCPFLAIRSATSTGNTCETPKPTSAIFTRSDPSRSAFGSRPTCNSI